MNDTLVLPERSIPANVAAEGAVLGSILIDPEALAKVAGTLKAEHFYRERHGWIYAAMLAIHERGGASGEARARTIFEALGAKPLIARVENALAAGGPAAPASGSLSRAESSTAATAKG